MPNIKLLISCCALLTACGSYRAPQGLWYEVKAGDTLSELSQRYHVPLDDLVELNMIEDPSKIQVGARLFVPRARLLKSAHLAKPTLIATLSRPVISASKSAAKGLKGVGSDELTGRTPNPELLKGHPPLALMERLRWPLTWGGSVRVSSPFGPRGKRPHKGLDLSAPTGTPTLSALPGKVTRVAFEAKGYGWYVIIDHGQGVETRYAHHSEVSVKEGDELARGAQVGEVGNTGRSSGPHLHFELRYQGRALDPLLYLPALP